MLHLIFALQLGPCDLYGGRGEDPDSINRMTIWSAICRRTGRNWSNRGNVGDGRRMKCGRKRNSRDASRVDLRVCGTGQCVRNYIVNSGDVPDVSSELGDVREVSCLARRALSGGSDCTTKRPMISEHREVSSVQMWAKMFDC